MIGDKLECRTFKAALDDTRLFVMLVMVLKYTEQKKFSNFDLSIGNFQWIVLKTLPFHISTLLHA
jgi:hypothetical protein